MALYSKYPLDSIRYLNIDSANRDRSLFPYSTDFDIVLPNNGKETATSGLTAVDPIYNGYPIEFGYFGSCSNNPGNYPYGLQLSEQSSDSSNFYSTMIIQDETVYPRNYANIISYDATTQTTGFSKSVITSGWKKTYTDTTGIPGQPGSLYSIRKEPPLAQGSCWIMPSPYQVNLVNTGVISINVNQIGKGVSFETDYNSDFDYTSFPITFNKDSKPPLNMAYGFTGVSCLNKSTGNISNILLSVYKNGNAVLWKPNTRFFVGNILYITQGQYTYYYIVITTGITSDIIPSITLTPNIPSTDGTCVYAYIGNTYPKRKKWLPSTHFNIGDILGYGGQTFLVIASTNLGISGIFPINPLIYSESPITDGDLTLQTIYWYNTDPGFGLMFPSLFTLPDKTTGYRYRITFNWTPNTYMAEGTIGVISTQEYGIIYMFCVYKAGTSGSISPVPTPAGDYQPSIVLDGSAYVFFYNDTSIYDYRNTFVVDEPIIPIIGKVQTPNTYVGEVINIGNINNLCIQGIPEPIIFQELGNSATGILVPPAEPPYIINTNTIVNNFWDIVPNGRYNILPWQPNFAYNTGEYLYYGLNTFNIIRGGISGRIPPTSTSNQTNGTLLLSFLPYTDPYKGCLLKITQTEDSDSTFAPYYARIAFYNPNTNIVTLETPLPVTEKRCLYEILSFSYDNFNPLQYTLSPFFSNISTPMIFYDVTLVSLTLPNLPVYSANNINILTSGQSQPFDSYPKVGSFPYLIVILKNTRMLSEAVPYCSNNPNEYKSTFRVSVTDANPNLASLFTRLSGYDTKTIRLDPNDNLRMTITDPKGNILIFADPTFQANFITFVDNGIPYPDTINYTGDYIMGNILPIPPSYNKQVSAVFSIRPHIT